MDIYTLVLWISALVSLFWLYTRWNEARSRQAFAERGIKFVDLGNLFFDIILRRRVELKKEEIIKKDGKLFGFNMLGRYTVLVAEPELIQPIMSKEFTNFTNRRPIKMPDVILSKVLTLTEDDMWKRLRSVITPTFSAGKLRRMKPCIDETLSTLMDNMDNSIGKSEVVDLKQVVGAFTMDTIIQIAFGVKINSLVDPTNPIIVHAKMAFSRNFTLENLLSFTMILFAPKLAKLIGARVNREPVDFFHKMALDVIKKKRAELAGRKSQDSSHSTANNFIELLLEAEIETNALENGSTEHKQKFITNDEVVAQCVLFFIVGYDTTATTITMVSYSLALNPDVQERLYQEIQQVLRKLSEESETKEQDPVKLVTLESLNRFEYLDAVVKESLRLYTPLLFTERVAAKDIRLETADGKMKVDLKKGDVVHIPAYNVHRDPKHFPDPERFDPERFLTDTPTFHKYAYMPFGNGPRSCVAKSLAVMEAKLAVLHLVRNYKMSRCAETKVPVDLYYQSNIVIPRDVRVKVEKRN